MDDTYRGGVEAAAGLCGEVRTIYPGVRYDLIVRRKEHHTMSEPIRKALRQYERKDWWEDMNAYGRAKAAERGLTEADVVPAVNAVRKQRRARAN